MLPADVYVPGGQGCSYQEPSGQYTARAGPVCIELQIIGLITSSDVLKRGQYEPDGQMLQSAEPVFVW